MAIITFPTIRRPSQARWRPFYNVIIHQSRYTRSVSTNEIPGRTFSAELYWENLSENEIALIESWMGKMRGAANRFYMSPPHRPVPLGAANTMSGGFIPRVNGVSQTGLSLITDGWSLSTTNILLEGDYISFDNGIGKRELKVVTANVSTNGSGQATIPIDDPIRSPPADNTLINFKPATGLFVIYEQGQEDGGLEVNPPILGSWKLTVLEDN